MNEAGHITLINGPGEGKRFYVQRAPTFIRAVNNIEGKWDILDLVDDEPTPQEEIHVYKQLSWMHVRANDRRASGFYYDYVYVKIRSDQKASLRYNRAWRQWATLMGQEEQRRRRLAS